MCHFFHYEALGHTRSARKRAFIIILCDEKRDLINASLRTLGPSTGDFAQIRVDDDHVVYVRSSVSGTHSKLAFASSSSTSLPVGCRDRCCNAGTGVRMGLSGVVGASGIGANSDVDRNRFSLL